MNAHVAILLLIFAPCAVVPWMYSNKNEECRRKHRIIAWCFAITAFLLVAGIPAWREALVSLIANPAGFAILTGLDIAFGLAFWHEAIHRGKKIQPSQAPGSAVALAGKKSGRPKRQPNKHHHRIRTPVVSMVFATCAALTIGSLGEMLAQISKSPAAAGAAISQSNRQIARISAGHHAPMTHHHAAVIVVIGALILLALIIAARSAENRRSGGGKPKAISGGFATSGRR